MHTAGMNPRVLTPSGEGRMESLPQWVFPPLLSAFVSDAI
jgi:hypothetical protein